MSEPNETEIPQPPPAPPLPQCRLVPKKKSNTLMLNLKEVPELDEDDVDLAISRQLLKDVDYDSVFYKVNTYCTPQLQCGPKCGLVALSIATSALINSVSVDELFDMARSHRLTRHGEIFDVRSLAYLAEKCCGFRAKILAGGLRIHFHCVMQCLLNRYLLLVPYDADFNHSPCCKNGAKAHWALITGFVIIQRKQKKMEEVGLVVLKSSKCSFLCNCYPNEDDQEIKFSLCDRKVLIKRNSPTEYAHLREGKIYLIGMQGKSRHVGLWLFDEMADSNDNLVSLSPDRDSGSYVIPRGGLVEGLKGKALILG